MAQNLPANAGDTRDSGLIPGSGRSPGVGNGNPLQCSCLKNSMDRGACGLHSMGLQRVRHATEHTRMHPLLHKEPRTHTKESDPCSPECSLPGSVLNAFMSSPTPTSAQPCGSRHSQGAHFTDEPLGAWRSSGGCPGAFASECQRRASIRGRI